MCSKVLLCTFFICAFFYYNTANAQINISDDQTAAALAQKLAGQGVTILNPTLSCAWPANGFFKAVNSNLGLDSGIVLTTGRVATTGGYYGVNGDAIYLASNDNGYPGDATLNVLAGQQTKDACKLEFDVIPLGDTISIDYVFSSEEYINAVCGPYNDAFAFFISGPGIAVTDNMALVPGTNIPVTINTINNGIPGSSGDLVNCTSMGAGSPFTAYYRENGSGNTVTHRGMTTVLKAVHAVTPCGKYHLKIVIADAGNAKYDSGVFLAAGSLKTGDYKVLAVPPVAANDQPICIKGCLPGRFRIKRTKAKSQPQTIHFITAGSAVSGIDFAPLADSVIIPAFDTATDVFVNGIPTMPNGPKTLQLFIYAPSVCNSISSIIDSAAITIYDTLHINVQPHDTVICGNDTVLMRVSGDDIYRYSWQPDINISDKQVKQPFVFPDAHTSYTVTASLPGSACPFKTATADFVIRETPHIILAGDTTVCYNATFQFAPAVMPANSFYSYQWSGPDAFSGTTLSPVLSNVSGINSGLYNLIVKNDTNGCTARASINVTVNVPDTPQVISPVNFCLNSQPVFWEGGKYPVLWYSSAGVAPATSPPQTSTATVAQFQYFVSQVIDNCESPKARLLVSVTKCCDGKIFIPTGFTPNGDGENDRFRPLPDYGYFLKNMEIYNRWGQVVYSGNTSSWDGNIGMAPAAGGVYFYKMIFGCILGGTEERVGDITLIR